MQVLNDLKMPNKETLYFCPLDRKRRVG